MFILYIFLSCAECKNGGGAVVGGETQNYESFSLLCNGSGDMRGAAWDGLSLVRLFIAAVANFFLFC